MSNATFARPGYGPALAARHLLTGAFRPRAAMREALAVHLGEGRRIAMFLAPVGACAALDPQVRSAGGFHLAIVGQNNDPADWALAGFIYPAVFFVVGALVYISQCVALHAAIRLATPSKASFSTTRTIVALSAWITAMLIFSALLVMHGLGRPQSFWFPNADTLIALLIVTPYLVLCASEALGLSIGRASLALVVAYIGQSAALLAIDSGIDYLNDVLNRTAFDDAS